MGNKLVKEHVFHMNYIAKFFVCFIPSVICYWAMIIIYQLIINGNLHLFWKEFMSGVVVAGVFSILISFTKNDFVSMDFEKIRIYQFPYKKEIKFKDIMDIEDVRFRFIKLIRIKKRDGYYYVPMIFSNSFHFKDCLMRNWMATRSTIS